MPDHILEEICILLTICQSSRLIFGYAIGGDEAGALGFGEFGEGAADFVAPGWADVGGEEIRLGEIAVVVGFFFRTHGDGVALGLIPEAGFLREAAAGFEDSYVALDFEFERFLQVAEGV